MQKSSFFVKYLYFQGKMNILNFLEKWGKEEYKKPLVTSNKYPDITYGIKFISGNIGV